MKARVKETGEIINIAEYARVVLDKCDGYGNPVDFGFDEVEILQEKYDNIDWEQRRYELAKAAMQGVLSNPAFCGTYSKREAPIIIALDCADNMIKKLKGE